MRHTKSTTTTTSTSSNVMPLNSMESLQLPAELIWDGKSEPNTPPSGELFSIVDYSIVENWIDEDNIAIEIIDTEQLSTIEDACELIDGDELVKELCNLKEETWNNAKPQPTTPNYVDEYMVDFSQTNPLSKVLFQTSLDGFNSLPGIASVGVDEFYTPVANNNNNNNNNLDNALLTQLTPPQSPPLNNNSIINNTQPFFSTDSQFNIIEQQPILLPTQQPETTFIWNNNPSIAAPLPTIQSTETYLQTQIVDEIVKTRAQELSDWSDEFEALSSSSISSFSASINTDDSSIEQQQPVETATTSTGTKKRRPYGRAIEDRKVRKKEQNKNAATRYRQKKKMEMEVVLSEEHELLQRNEELKRQLLERRKEAKYLKTLLREFQEKKQQQLKQKA